MKILRIRLRNLNSLKGDHIVDLTAEPLASAGLFAITGPTGAGKSTLLDAVTLALYGRAARYGNESNPEHVMSRHSGECSAEVEFEVPTGVYRAVWERHRARKKADGALQQPKRYIYDSAGQALAQQIREAEDKIEELLGLNYDRFLRSVLLAQGDFARFLKANANERAELLESLTGTVIYSRLGKLAHIEATAKEGELRAKEASIEGIAILDMEARKELEIAVKDGEKRRESLTKEVDAGTTMVGRIKALETERKKEKDSTADQVAVESDRKTAASDLERLRQHRLTVPFTADLARLESAESARTSAGEDRKQADAAYAEGVKALAGSNHILRAATKAALAASRERAKVAGEVASKEAKEASDARAWLDDHKNDACLTDQLADVVAALGEVKTSRTSLSNAWSIWKGSASGMLPESAEDLPEGLEMIKEAELESVLANFLREADKRRVALEAEGKEAKKQHELRKDHLDKAKLVAKLEDHRHALKDGEECPLCGALEHPYADKGAPGGELTELETEVEKASEKLDSVRDSYRNFSGTFKTLTESRDKLLERVRDALVSVERLVGLLQPLGSATPVPGGEDSLRTELQGRERSYREKAKAEEVAKKRHADAERTAREANLEAEVLEKKIDKLPPLSQGSEEVAIVPEDLPTVQDAEEAYANAVTREHTTSAKAADRKKGEEKAIAEMEKLRQPLEATVAVSEFQTLDRLRAAKLDSDEAKRIEGLDADLAKRATAADTLLKQAKAEIVKLLKEQVLEGDEATAFTASQDKLKEERDKLLEDQTTRRNQLKTDDDNRKLRKEKEAELEEDRKKLLVWRRLRDLIGSHDGSKFRRYAQAISLDILTRHANRHLGQLSDRYQICRDEEEALNLQIEDLHQVGVKRPMASLSGGESFLVSLALALGLSDLAGRTVRIDSLFVDEGFGSLDPDTLEVAIAALESLRQDRKTVGVISHVALLKERISTQILVEKQAGGVSRIRVIPEEAIV